jgi:hypothetical protein
MSDQSASRATAPAPKPLTADEQQQLQLQALLHAPVPRIYANGIGTAPSSSDISVIFLDVGQPVVIVKLAYTTAKSLVMDIGAAIKHFEEKTGEKVKDIRELDAMMQSKKSG